MRDTYLTILNSYGDIVELKAGKAYLLNTKKQHGSFAMVDDIYHILMGIYINPHNFRVVTGLLPNCTDHQ